MARRIKVVLSYDGTGYHGFQRQGRGLKTVQDVLYAAIAAVTGGPPERFAAAGRTDAGVHALGQVIAFDTGGSIPAGRIVQALNANLPDDVSVVGAAEADSGFHPRFDATGKTYAYTFYGWEAGARQALLSRHALFVPHPPDLTAIREAAAVISGKHDFSAFQDAGRPVKDPTRTVAECRLEYGSYIRPPLAGISAAHLIVRADGFLYHMVRIIAGTLLEVGRGRLSPADVAGLLDRGERSDAGPTLPPQGLCLMKVHYG